MMYALVLVYLGLVCFAGSTKSPKYPDPRHILSDIANISVAERPQGPYNASNLPAAAFALTYKNEDETKAEVTTVQSVGEDETRECTRPSKCEVLPHNVTCFDTTLPYNSISYMFTGLHHYWEVQSRLAAWSAFRNIPKCWSVIQPLLCAVYLPKCENGEVELVARQLCKATRGPCRLVDSIPQDGWPAFLQCNNFSVFRSEAVLSSAPFSISGIVSTGHRKKVSVIHGEEEGVCQGDQSERRLLRFNTTGNCLAPYFVKTTKSSNYYDLIDECGLACFSPQYSKEEHDSVVWSTRWGAWAGLMTSTWAFLSTILVHRSKRIRPSVQNHIILCMSVCSILIMIALIIPSLSEDTRRDVLCQSDGTRRISEPDSSQSSACSLVAFLIYFGAIGYGVWLVIFAASWVVTFSRLGKIKEDGLLKRQCSLHIAAWSIPFVLTTVLFVTNVIEADSLSGLCFVSGYVHTTSTEVYVPLIPVCLVVLPFVMVIIMLSIIAVKIGTDLRKTSRRTDSVLPEKAAPILKITLLRLSSVYFIAVIAVVHTIVHHIHIFNYSDSWAQHLKDFLVCSLLKSSPEAGGPDISCDIKDRLSLVRVRLQLACAFLPPLQLAILVSNHTTLKLWKRLVRKILELRLRPKHLTFPHNSPEMKGKFKVGVKKHQLISKAYMKRNEFRKTGRLSLSINSLHEDPMGLPMSQMENKNSQDQTSNELSSSWVAALPRLIERRNGCKGAIQLGLKRSDSIDSKLHLSQSFSIRSNRLSLSRQHSYADSLASQMSMQQTQDGMRRGRDSRHRKLNFFRSQRFNSKFRSSRRSSITSHENSSASQILPAVTLSSRVVTDGQQPVRKFADLRQKTFQEDETDRILEEKLRHLVEASRTSHETFRQEEATKNSTAVQTSLTDLANLGKSVETKSCGTQWSPHLDHRSLPTTSTASSSQTESNYFLPNRDLHKFNPPIEPNVIKISVPHQKDSSTESSIPSSYEKLCLSVPGPAVHSTPGFPTVPRNTVTGLFPCEVARHNQRRGAIVGDNPIIIRPNLVMSEPSHVVPRQQLQTLDVRNFEEIELNVRSHLSRSLLDKNPDSIVAISTPSS